jgi:ribonuclease T2
MPMRPIAKWRAREQDWRAGDIQWARFKKPLGSFACPKRLGFARRVLPRAGGVTSRLMRAGPLQTRAGYPLAAQGSSPRRRGTPGDFDYYVLSLSWSSAFCETPAGERARGQCDAGANLGFVVHGLWPQYEHGYPSDCGPAARFPSRTALESAQGVYPSEGLARHEWQKHGTCSGKSPTDYFADVRRARESIVIPTPFAAPKEEQTWTPVDIARAFIASNPRLRPGMLGVACASSVLQEVRICFSKDLRDFHACPEVSRQGCRVREVAVPPVL